jgi:hypothetical protein
LSESLAESREARYDSDRPKFVARKGVLLRVYHVLVIWPDGRREKVGCFGRRLGAARWIEEKSADWLAHYRPAEMPN